MAAECGRLGRPDVLPRLPRLSRHRARSPRSRALEPAVEGQRSRRIRSTRISSPSWRP